AAVARRRPDLPGPYYGLRGRPGGPAPEGAAGRGGRRPPVRPRGLPGPGPHGPQRPPADLPLGRLDRPAHLAPRPDRSRSRGHRPRTRAPGHLTGGERLRRRPRELRLVE